MKKTTLAAIAAVLATATVAYAAPGMMKAQQGPVTLEQAKAKSDAMFDRMDANHDGQIDQADRQARRDERFAQIDTNNDGSISKSEFEAMPMMRDGMRGDGRHDMHGKRDGRDGMRMMGRMADTNHDGVITRAEFNAGATAHFAKVDTNGDGKITDAERQAAHDKMRDRFQQMREARDSD